MLKEITKSEALDLFMQAEEIYIVKAVTKNTPVMDLAYADGVFVNVKEKQEDEPEGLEEEPTIEESLLEPLTDEAEIIDALPPDEPDKYPAKKKRGGKKKELDKGKIKALYEGNWSIGKIADEMGVSYPTIKKAINEIYE